MGYLFVGLGNPTVRYAHTRHNVGFQFIDYLSKTYHINCKKALFRPLLMGRGLFNDKELWCAKPLTYMNCSGKVLPYLLKKSRLNANSLVVICDNLDLKPGEIRLKAKGSSGGQRGLQSIIDVLGTDQFKRLFIGVGRPQDKEDVISHVLGVPEEEEAILLQNGIEKGAKALLALFSDSIHQVMSWANIR